MIEYNSDTRQSPNIALPIGLLFALSARVPRQPQRDSLALGRNDPASDRDRSISWPSEVSAGFAAIAICHCSYARWTPNHRNLT
jgi:hypothetical protein